MFLTSLTLSSFRNHTNTSVAFSSKVTAITGNNGTGKTNLLDAVYFLCLTKSNLFTTDQQSIQFGSDFLRLEGRFKKKQLEEVVVCKLQQGKRKEFWVNDLPYSKLSDHIGLFPCMMISPSDSEVILGGGEERRKLIDSALSQTDESYLELLIHYNKLLAQRNAALKHFAESGRTDKGLLNTYDSSLIPIGAKLFQKRKNALTEIRAIFKNCYEQISLNRDEVSLQYVSQLENKSFEVLMTESLQKDLVLQRTDSGIHKDDLELLINNVSAKKFGSQGQQKCVLIALKLALFQYVKKQKGFNPILLVDDIFDKLDTERGNALLEVLSGDLTGQVLLTHTDSSDFREQKQIDIIDIKSLI